MTTDMINRALYDAIVNFDNDATSQEYYYKIMDSPTGKTGKNGEEETVRDRILRAYAVLFCEDIGATPGKKADVDNVVDTADRLYVGSVGYDPEHWYRMKYHFPIIDEDNYDRFAALVISDLKAGPLREAAINDGETLVVGEADPLHMTIEERRNQKTHSVGNRPEGGAI